MVKREPLEVELSIATDQVCFIIVKAREFEAKDWPAGLQDGSNSADDNMIAVLESRRDDPVFDELRSFINALDVDQQIDLVALAWVGRGDFDIDEWDEARAEAEAARSTPTADYLLGMPLISEFLEEGLAAAGRSCAEEEKEHL
ncbi:MAG: DUF3775 domain-containing protein [Rhizobiales bacterium]|nr:DUF3775 domain-containing protein [Hyphomicrobiales bacterium]MBI3674177.1 DUF3775 domain-containing protein [Hyphomicrobiales bacterium]